MNTQKQALDYTWDTINPFLNNMRIMFDLVRLVDAEECREVTIQDDGTLHFGQECYAVWGADYRCSNCTSFQSCHTQQKKHRVEYYQGKQYQIQSVPVRITLPDQSVYSCNLELIHIHSLSEEESAQVHPVNKDEKETSAYLTTHDSLTGLLNWDGFCHKVRQLITDDPDQKRIIISANIRNFKLVNSLFGRSKGDEVLTEVAALLRQISGENGACSRNGSDIFAVCIPKEEYQENRLAECAHRIKDLIDSPSYRPDIHFGIYEIIDPNLSISIMFDWAYMALQSIRDNRERIIAWFDDSLLKNALHEQKVISNFEHNLSSGQFVIYLQPQLDIRERIEGAECLVRWVMPNGEVVPPLEFIKILEQSDLISSLDKYVWELAVKQLDRWKNTEYSQVYLSINVSPRDFYYLNVEKTLMELCKKYDVPPQMLHVEITETAIADEMQDNKYTVELLQKDGFTVEIDDFGKGSSSLSLLKDIKADVLKIDMGFLRQSENENRSNVILESVIDMAKRLGMEVITEGVETVVQLHNLTALGCDMFQGYYFSRPVPVNVFEKLAKGRSI